MATRIDPAILGVVFTMIQFAGEIPIIAVRNYVTHTEQYEVPVFRQMIRESKTLFATAGERGVPAVLLSSANPNVQHGVARARDGVPDPDHDRGGDVSRDVLTIVGRPA